MIKYVIGILAVLFILIASIYLWSKSQLMPTKFNSLHPQIVVLRKGSYLLDIYTNRILDIKNRSLWDVKPKVIGIFYTDKIRADNQIFDKEDLLEFGSTISAKENGEVSIYIYVSENVINNSDAKEKIKDYILDVIGYYQFLGTERKDDKFSNFLKLPIDVKKN